MLGFGRGYHGPFPIPLKDFDMENEEILKKETSICDEFLEYKKGKRTRSQVDSIILKLMQKARDAERVSVVEERVGLK